VQKENHTNEYKNRPVYLPGSSAAQGLNHLDILLRYLEKCNRDQNLDKKIHLLKFINSVLPEEIQLRIPPLVTDDYVDIALYNIEMACKRQIIFRNYFLLPS
jgi:hypothetical protein